MLPQGTLICIAGLPGTLVLGVVQAVLPPVVVDVLAWCMVAWIAVTGFCHWAATVSLGLGWMGLVLPQVVLLVS
jgi:hypothetical protein